MISLIIMESCGCFCTLVVRYESSYGFQQKLTEEVVRFQNHVIDKYDLDEIPEVKWQDMSHDPAIHHFFNKTVQFSEN